MVWFVHSLTVFFFLFSFFLSLMQVQTSMSTRQVLRRNEAGFFFKKKEEKLQAAKTLPEKDLTF